MKPSPAHGPPPEKDITPREIGVAHNAVSDFLKDHPTFRGYDFEDLLQECLLHWSARRHLYRPGLGASPSTFLGKILRRKLLDILDREMAQKRRVNQRASPLPEEDGDDERLAPPLPAVPSGIPHLHLRLAVAEILASLHPGQARLCELLKEGMTVAAIGRELKKPRPSIYDEMRRIRKIFREAGLQEFL